jgi:hypothetical protein
MSQHDPRDLPAVPSRPGAAPANAATCHPDVVCPVCTAKGKSIRMVPVKAHYQCPECRYFDSCCM